MLYTLPTRQSLSSHLARHVDRCDITGLVFK